MLLLWKDQPPLPDPRPGTAWARSGLTPVLQRVGKRREFSSVMAITPDGPETEEESSTEAIARQSTITALRKPALCSSQ